MSLTATPTPLSRRERLRRVVLVCCHFTRNLAYYRVGHPGEPRYPNRDFWVTTNGNFLDQCVLEWCKLLGDLRGEHHWKQIVSDPVTFEAEILRHLGMTAVQFDDYIKQMRAYRDKFVAHLDSLRQMHPPRLDSALASIQFYHRHDAHVEASPGILSGLPASDTELSAYYDQCTAEAGRVYSLIDNSAPMP